MYHAVGAWHDMGLHLLIRRHEGFGVRDAFNGLPLWRRPIADWGWKAWSADWTCRFTVPTHILRERTTREVHGEGDPHGEEENSPNRKERQVQIGSFLLQQGHFVGDVCYYYGDQGANFVPPKHFAYPFMGEE